MIEFRSLSLKELQDVIVQNGEPKFRAKQIFKWIHKGVEDFNNMTDLSKNLREKLNGLGYIKNMEVAQKQVSKIDGTTKYLLKLNDGNLIECVLMRYNYGNSICISTQAGCSMGCKFCASTIGGKVRNLTPGEMIGQILTVQNDIKEKISNVVLMGTGEPLDNFDNTIKFLELLKEPEGLHIGMRHITISTCGLVPEIKRLADLNYQITLAISLHAPNDIIRRQIMPIAYRYPMEELLEASKYYIEKTGRRITFEYTMIEGFNDKKEHAKELAEKLRGLLCHVNLIPVNTVVERDLKRSNQESILRFKNILEENGIDTTIRRELGSDIDAACGQLRRRYQEG
ncbi:23S rRNA (adenine(2503)-C(2))-methyltransferase RlmN [Thermobrachium celere]|uniref:Probable dual-specificity RNA methyltransferase RlmN n=1 Tax=Thermobrachium celere DSM 8682 TaxID=941824 RepID=R7RRK3_9CLOT|nr:23S rRNA (adenine(2503)-C(2))-methyltransferase RlmN [Thermobrachium celere]GFR35065.1 putative dual-specificity RNA methyltransferase RlmN [Thermobrachium celere]CDF57890.1 Ribosomal RNA large subunit methyltransferase N [Thermobrachium celere DSM 8682]